MNSRNPLVWHRRLFPVRPHRLRTWCWLLLLGLLCSTPRTSAALDLQRVDAVVLVPTDWGDGDSFRVRFPSGEEHTLRLYGVDCLESRIHDESDARRLRAQRRAFGISGYGGTPEASISLARAMGMKATKEVKDQLSRPFTVYTAFADARGDERYSRVYAFVVTADGKDLSLHLVQQGLARAYGVYRSAPDGTPQQDLRERLRDAELVAARKGMGIWAYTDWEALPSERNAEREEAWELRLATGQGLPSSPVDVNGASRDELMRLPGVGEATALAIIEARPFQRPEDLLRVRGIGPKTLEGLRPYVRFSGAEAGTETQPKRDKF